MAGKVARRGAPLQRQLPPVGPRRPTKRAHVDLAAELLRTRLDLEASERARASIRTERDGLRDELERAIADLAHKDAVIASLRARLERLSNPTTTNRSTDMMNPQTGEVREGNPGERPRSNEVSFHIGEVVEVKGCRFVVHYINAGKRRLTLVPAKTLPKAPAAAPTAPESPAT